MRRIVETGHCGVACRRSCRAMAGTRIGIAMTALVSLVLGSCARDDPASEVDPGGVAPPTSAEGSTGAGGGGGSGSGGSGGSSDRTDPARTPPSRTHAGFGEPAGRRQPLRLDRRGPPRQPVRQRELDRPVHAADLVSPGRGGGDGRRLRARGVHRGRPAETRRPPCPGFVFTPAARVCTLAVAPISGSDTSGSSYTLRCTDASTAGRSAAGAVATSPLRWPPSRCCRSTWTRR